MNDLRPFFTYYGGKWRAAPRYPSPAHDTIIEPFAGSAGYSVRHPDRSVHLYDVDPIVAGVWDYLIHVSPADVMRLPVVVHHVDDLAVPEEAKHLIGFWLNKGVAQPVKQPSAWVRAGTHPNSVWGRAVRYRIATQVPRIRHWTITNGSYTEAPDIEATWFVDPPYKSKAGRHYKYDDVNFTALGEWCRSRKGQAIVCEQEGADWLPFRSMGEIKSTLGASKEMVWSNHV